MFKHWQPKSKDKIVVTGGNGFIASHLVDKLIFMDYDVHVIDDLSAESNEKFYFNDNATYYKENILNYDKINKIFKKAKYVFHLAAESRIQPAIKNPIYATQVNVVGTVNVLEASRLNFVNRIMFSSTSSVYGMTEHLPITEKTHTDCLNPYSASKLAAEEMIKMYSKLFNLDSCIFRYFNVYGERSPVKGQYAPVIGIFLDKLNKKQNLTVVGDGKQRRDFVHVQDIVQANILGMLHKDSINGEIYNVGNGENFSVNEIAEMISSKIVYIPQRAGEARNTLANISKIKKDLGYTPKIDLKKWLFENGQ